MDITQVTGNDYYEENYRQAVSQPEYMTGSVALSAELLLGQTRCSSWAGDASSPFPSKVLSQNGQHSLH